MLVPNGQQEQLGPPQDPNDPNVPQQAQNPVQVQQKYLLVITRNATKVFAAEWTKINYSFKTPSDVSTFSVPSLWISSVSQATGMMMTIKLQIPFLIFY